MAAATAVVEVAVTALQVRDIGKMQVKRASFGTPTVAVLSLALLLLVLMLVLMLVLVLMVVLLLVLLWLVVVVVVVVFVLMFVRVLAPVVIRVKRRSLVAPVVAVVFWC